MSLRRIALYMLFFCLSVAGILAFLNTLAPPWPDPVEGIDLTPALPPLAYEDITPDNGFYYVMQLEELDEPDDYHEQMAAWRKYGPAATNTTAIKEFHQSIEPQFALLRKAAQAPTFQWAFNEERSLEILPLLNISQYHAARLLLADPIDGVDSAETLGWALTSISRTKNGANLIQGMVYSACHGIYLRNVTDLALTRHAEDAGVLRQLAAVLRDHSDRGMTWTDAAEVLREEVRFVRPGLSEPWQGFMIQDGELGGVTPELPVFVYALLGSGEKQATRRYEEGMAHLIHACEQHGDFSFLGEPVWREFLDAHPGRHLIGRDPWSRLTLTQEYGLIELFSGGMKDLVLHVNAHKLIAETTIALRRYQLDHDEAAPPDLATLVPDYLEGVPVDVFDPDGKSLVYEPDDTAWTLRSVGENGIDDHETREGLPGGRRDVVVRYPVQWEPLPEAETDGDTVAP